MARARKSKLNTVSETDELGRPRVVEFSGDPSLQCPACLSVEVEPWGAVGFLPAGNELIVGDNAFAPVRPMRCRDCGARWMRPGI